MESPPLARAPRGRARRWSGRIVRNTLNGVLIALILVLGIYLSRRVWLEDLIREEVIAALETALDAEVQVGAIGGNWIDTITVDDVWIRKSELIEVSRGRVEVALSLGALLEGEWLDLLDGALIGADRLRVTLPESRDEPVDEPAEPLTLPEDLVALASKIAPSGIELQVEDCEIVTRHGRLQDRLRVTLEPRRQLRHILVSFADLELDGEIRAASEVVVEATIDGPGEVLRSFGVETRLRDGLLRTRFEITAPASLRAVIDLDGAQLERRGAAALHAEVDFPSGRTWRADRLEFSVPGARITAPRLAFADPRTTTDLLGSLQGELDVSIDDCARFRDLLPDDVAPWLPRNGQVAGRIADGAVQIETAKFIWDRGLAVQVESGSLPLAAPAAGAAANEAAELQLTATLTEPTSFEIPGAGSLTLVGTVGATLAGALTDPSVDATISLGVGSFGATRWSSCEATVRLDAQRDAKYVIVVNDLAHDIPGLNLAPARVAADGTARLGDTVTVQTRLDIDERRVVDRQSWSIAGDVAFDGDAISTPRLELGGPIEAAINGSFAVGANMLDLRSEQLRLATGDLGKMLGTDLPTGTVTGRLAARGELTNPSIDAAFDAILPDLTDESLAGLWPQSFGARPADPLEIQFALVREPAKLRIETLRARIGDSLSFHASGVPPIAWDGERLATTSGGEGVRGGFSLRLPSAEGTPTDTEAEFTWSGDALVIEEILLDGFEQRVRGRARLDGVGKALTGEREFTTIELDATIDAEPFDLRLLPREWTGLGSLQGTAELSARVDGTIGSPLPTGTLTVHDGRAKFPTIPTLDALEIDIALTTDENGAAALDLRQVSGALGAGPFVLTGGIRTASLTPQRLEDVAIDLELHGDNLLLLRETGIKVRADTDLSASGTLADLQVTGTVALTSGKLVRRISLVPDFRSKGGASASGGLELPKIPDPIGSAIKWNIELRTEEPFEVALHIIEAPFAVSARLRGTGAAPQIEGGISTLDGIVRLPAMSLDITQAYLDFAAERPRFPKVVATAQGRRLGVDVLAQVEGPIDNVTITLSSTPALAQEDITILLTTGRLPDDLRERGLQSQAALVGSYLAEEIYNFYFGSDSTEATTSFVDRFAFESGREVSSNGTESLTVEFLVQEGWYMQAERDAYEDYNMGVLYRIRF